MSKFEVEIRPADAGELESLQAVREAAFAPVFASFRAILGEDIYQLAQRRDDEAQGDLLATLLTDGNSEVYAAELDGQVVGFVTIQLNRHTKVGEIGLNAVHPAHAGQGIGEAMYQFALERMRNAGMQVATVGTGGDPSHEPARRAYRKVGFDREIPSVWMFRKL